MDFQPKEINLPFELLENAAELARYQGWSEEVYRDLLAVRHGTLAESEFLARYRWEKAVMVLDLTGFTQTTMEYGELHAILRILEAHMVCLPVIRDGGADFVRSFADDLVALFNDPCQAVSTAVTIHTRMNDLAASNGGRGASCCIGIGYGQLLKIGPNLAQGDEMNRASRLGEDIAGASETLVTENVYRAVTDLPGFEFERPASSKAPFPYYRLTTRKSR